MSRACHPIVTEIVRLRGRWIRTMAIITLCLVSGCPPLLADPPGLLSTEIPSNAVPIRLTPEVVFADQVNGAVMTVRAAAFSQTASTSLTGEPVTMALFERTEPLDEHAVPSSWKPSTKRLAGLSGAPGDRQMLTDFLPRLAGVTLFVLVTCAVALWLARRWLTRHGMGPHQGSSSRLTVTDSLSFAPHSHLHIVRIDEREYLAAVNSQGLQQVVAIPPVFEDVFTSLDQQSVGESTIPRVYEQSRVA